MLQTVQYIHDCNISSVDVNNFKLKQILHQRENSQFVLCQQQAQAWIVQQTPNYISGKSAMFNICSAVCFPVSWFSFETIRIE